MSEKENARPRQERQSSSKPLARELRRMIVWTEVLDKPLARRKPRFR